MRRVVFTVTSDITYDQRMERICSALAQNGYDVLIIGREKKDSVKLNEKPYKQRRIRCFFDKGKFFYLEYNIRLFLKLLFVKADIISSIDLDTILPGFLISKIRSKKFVYDAHEYFTEVIEVVNRPRIKQIWEWVESLVVPRVKYAYTVSDGLKNLFEAKYGVLFEVIRNVPLLEKFEEPQKSEKNLVYIGAVNKGRGLEEMIEVMPFIDSKLFVYGDGDVYEELIVKVKDAGLSDKINFFGYIEPSQLREVTRQAYIGVLLLKNESLSYYYSLANKFFDYMHAGIPQVVIDFPEYRTINAKYQVAELATLDKGSIIEAINKLLKDEVNYFHKKENCYKAREDFNWQNESIKLINFYDKIVKDNE